MLDSFPELSLMTFNIFAKICQSDQAMNEAAGFCVKDLIWQVETWLRWQCDDAPMEERPWMWTNEEYGCGLGDSGSNSGVCSRGAGSSGEETSSPGNHRRGPFGGGASVWLQEARAKSLASFRREVAAALSLTSTGKREHSGTSTSTSDGDGDTGSSSSSSTTRNSGRDGVNEHLNNSAGGSDNEDAFLELNEAWTVQDVYRAYGLPPPPPRFSPPLLSTPLSTPPLLPLIERELCAAVTSGNQERGTGGSSSSSDNDDDDDDGNDQCQSNTTILVVGDLAGGSAKRYRDFLLRDLLGCLPRFSPVRVCAEPLEWSEAGVAAAEAQCEEMTAWFASSAWNEKSETSTEKAAAGGEAGGAIDSGGLSCGPCAAPPYAHVSGVGRRVRVILVSGTRGRNEGGYPLDDDSAHSLLKAEQALLDTWHRPNLNLKNQNHEGDDVRVSAILHVHDESLPSELRLHTSPWANGILPGSPWQRALAHFYSGGGGGGGGDDNGSAKSGNRQRKRRRIPLILRTYQLEGGGQGREFMRKELGTKTTLATLPVGWFTGYLGPAMSGPQAVYHQLQQQQQQHFSVGDLTTASTNAEAAAAAVAEEAAEEEEEVTRSARNSSAEKKSKRWKWVFVGSRAWRFKESVKSRNQMLSHLSSFATLSSFTHLVEPGVVPSLGPLEVADYYRNSDFAPSPRGDSQDCFRHYEATIHGAIPIVDAPPHHPGWPWNSDRAHQDQSKNNNKNENNPDGGAENQELPLSSASTAALFHPLGWIFPEPSSFSSSSSSSSSTAAKNSFSGDGDGIADSKSDGDPQGGGGRRLLPSSWPPAPSQLSQDWMCSLLELTCDANSNGDSNGNGSQDDGGDLAWRSMVLRASLMGPQEVELRRAVSGAWFVATVQEHRKQLYRALFERDGDGDDEHTGVAAG